MKLRKLVKRLIAGKTMHSLRPWEAKLITEGVILLNETSVDTYQWKAGDDKSDSMEAKGSFYYCKVPNKLKAFFGDSVRMRRKKLERYLVKKGLCFGVDTDSRAGWILANLPNGKKLVIAYGNTKALVVTKETKP